MRPSEGQLQVWRYVGLTGARTTVQELTTAVCFVVVGFKTLLSRNVIKVLATFRKAHFLNLFSGEGGTPNETAVALGTAIPGTVVILILAAVFVWWDCFRPKVRKIFCIRLYAQQYLSNETTVVRYHQTFIVLQFSNLNCKSSALV